MNGNYDPLLEEKAFSNSKVKFYSLPVTGNNSYSSDLYYKYKSAMSEAESLGPVITHCRSG
jgi:protein tyrosine phosphatase (PTP) superfamily phosphohydrolase (DUF442 family)